jgi:hypothetical protein
MVRIPRVVENHPNANGLQGETIAAEICKGRGGELGAAAHNPFSLPGSINVCPFSEDPNDKDYGGIIMNRDHQIDSCGACADIDPKGLADSIPVPDRSQDFVISSHVIEHVPDAISASPERDERRLFRMGVRLFGRPRTARSDSGRKSGV